MSSSRKRNTTAQLNPFKEEASSTTKKNKKKNDVVWIGIKIIKALLLEDKRITLGFCFISCLLLAQFFLMRVFYVSFFLGKHNKGIHNNNNVYDDKFNTPPVVVGSLNDLLQSMNMNHEDDGMTTNAEDDSSSSSVSDTSLYDSSSLVKNDNNNELKLWSKEEILELSFTVPTDYSVFDNCFDPYSSSSNNATHNNDNDNNNVTPCSYFRPSQFLKMEEIEEYLSSPETLKMREKSAKPNMKSWAREMNNWPHNMDGHGPPLLPDPKTVNRASLNEIESLTYFGCPKCGSRTIFSLVLDHLVDPKVDMPRFGFISPEYAKQFELLQQQQKEETSGKTITLRKKREHVAFAIFRDIVSRFISGLYQLHSMIGTKRCAENCEEHLYKCLLDDELDLPRTEYEQEKLSRVIDCYANVVKENGFFDEHLVPMTWYFTQHFHGYNDIEIAMFPMEHLNFLTKYGFGVEKDLHENSRFEDKPNKKKQQTKVVPARNNINNKKRQQAQQQNPNKGHRRLQHQRQQNPPNKREETEEAKKKKVVENMMNVLKHLTNPLMLKRETRKRICDLYATDVVLIRSIHFPLQSCDFSF